MRGERQTNTRAHWQAPNTVQPHSHSSSFCHAHAHAPTSTSGQRWAQYLTKWHFDMRTKDAGWSGKAWLCDTAEQLQASVTVTSEFICSIPFAPFLDSGTAWAFFHLVFSFSFNFPRYSWSLRCRTKVQGWNQFLRQRIPARKTDLWVTTRP